MHVARKNKHVARKKGSKHQAAEHSYSKAGDQDAATKEILEPAK